MSIPAGGVPELSPPVPTPRQFDRLPSVVALPLHEYATGGHPVMRLHRLFEAVETLIRPNAVIASGEVPRKSGSIPLPEDLLQELQPGLEHPTFSRWGACPHLLSVLQ